jgi:hypothetical protein
VCLRTGKHSLITSRDMTVSVALFVVALVAQAAGQEGTVKGMLTVNGRSIPLAHVYATAQEGALDKTKEDVRVLLSSVPLSDAVRADVFDLIRLGREGKASIVEIVIDASGSPISGGFFLREFDGMLSATGMHAFRRDMQSERRIVGRLSMANPSTFSGVTMQYDATFDAPIPRPPTEAERKAALATPPAAVAAAYVDAIKKGDLAAFRATLGPELARDFSGAAGAERFGDLQREMPADSRVVNLVPQTNGSVIVSVEGHAAGIVIGYALTVTRDGSGWKVTQ